MGHGAAKNILLKGYPITVLGHRNRAPVDDLVAGGAKEAASLAELANASDVVFTCLPSSIEVEATVFGDAGLLPAMRPGHDPRRLDDGRSELDPAHRPGT